MLPGNLSISDLKDDEMIIDNTIVCKNCGTPRMLTLEDGLRVRAMCKCQSEYYSRKEKEKAFQKRLEKMKYLQEMSLTGLRYKNSKFENLDLNVDETFVSTAERLKTFVERWQDIKEAGAGFYLYSKTPGNGKTELASCTSNALFERYIPAIVLNMIEVSKRLRYSYSQGGQSEFEFLRDLAGVDFLVIDDLGIECLSKSGADTFLQERLYDIINRRYILRKPTAFTSNFTLEQLVKERGLWLRTADRIREMSHAMIELKGASYRPKMREKIPMLF